MLSWASALKLAPWLAIALLGAAVLWLRGDLASAKAERDAAQVRVADMEAANASLAESLDLVRRQRADNDAIAQMLSAALAGNSARETITRETITEVSRNDPETRAWADTPVPLGVRDGLRADPVDPVAP